MQDVANAFWAVGYVWIHGIEGAEGKMKRCPICRNERAYPETAMLKGFDEFLSGRCSNPGERAR